MALETLTAQQVNRSGAQVSMQSVTTAGGFEFPNDGHTVLEIANDAGDATLTFTIQKKLDGQSATRTVVVAASQRWIIGPFPTELYNDGNGYVQVGINKDLASGIAILSF